MAKTRRSPGISGTALFLGTISLYLVYIGVKDIPFFDGLRAISRKTPPEPRATHEPYQADSRTADQLSGFDPSLETPTGGTLGLVGYALLALPMIRAVAGNSTLYGRAARPENPTSDHPQGKAIDIMTTDPAKAQRVINVFRIMVGAKYWIWNRQIANADVNNWQKRPYSGPNPHTDHVHLSFR